jgi:hypothetical protein
MNYSFLKTITFLSSRVLSLPIFSLGSNLKQINENNMAISQESLDQKKDTRSWYIFRNWKYKNVETQIVWIRCMLICRSSWWGMKVCYSCLLTYLYLDKGDSCDELDSYQNSSETRISNFNKSWQILMPAGSIVILFLFRFEKHNLHGYIISTENLFITYGIQHG